MELIFFCAYKYCLSAKLSFQKHEQKMAYQLQRLNVCVLEFKSKYYGPSLVEFFYCSLVLKRQKAARLQSHSPRCCPVVFMSQPLPTSDHREHGLTNGLTVTHRLA